MSSTTTPKRQNRLPAAYYRSGTSRAVMFNSQDLPQDRDQWAAIFRGVIGSPDVYGRQLDGMGGGISSLSKICVVGPSTVGDTADVDYTFAAIGVKDDDVDYSSNCGNMSSAIGPFAVDMGLVTPTTDNGECVVNIHNTNTGKIIRSTFPVVEGEAAASGDFAIAGVAGSGAPVRLDFVDPGGSKTGKLLPTGQIIDTCDETGIQMTCIDAGNPCVFVGADAIISPIPDELPPKAIEGDKALMDRLELIRRHAALRMGLAKAHRDVPGSIPKIAMVWAPRHRSAGLEPESGDICVRALSVGQPHKAVPVTVALSLAAAAQLPGTVVHRCLKDQKTHTRGIEICHPTGLLKVDATYNGKGTLESAAVYRTARRLMEGTVFWKQ
ncbi:hypothetical protein N0V82_010484 [Gnomoniopsis sp. IMI 355080]|nr:hypothetical protein N0V82_010484 [Gnomoniopsis sp. IMI 355080]